MRKVVDTGRFGSFITARHLFKKEKGKKKLQIESRPSPQTRGDWEKQERRPEPRGESKTRGKKKGKKKKKKGKEKNKSDP
jgi:hypothetical protein